ncbi:MAG TPA: hypothetical protein VJ936_06835 [Desulfobacteraceae bacterium]|nr:hypothetical protein [Desulfobacteraceae bacterium]
MRLSPAPPGEARAKDHDKSVCSTAGKHLPLCGRSAGGPVRASTFGARALIKTLNETKTRR